MSSGDNVFDEASTIAHDPLERCKPSIIHKGRSSTVDLGDVQG